MGRKAKATRQLGYLQLSLCSAALAQAETSRSVPSSHCQLTPSARQSSVPSSVHVQQQPLILHWRDLLVFSPLLKAVCGAARSPPCSQASGPPSCLLRASRLLPGIWGREAAHQNAADLTVKMLFSMSNVNVLCCNLSKLCTFPFGLACVSMQSKSSPSSLSTYHFPFSFPFLDQITPITSAFSQRKITSSGGCILILQQCNDRLYYSRMSSVTLWQATATLGSFFAVFFSNSSFSVCTVCYSCQSLATCIRPY